MGAGLGKAFIESGAYAYVLVFVVALCLVIHLALTWTTSNKKGAFDATIYTMFARLGQTKGIMTCLITYGILEYSLFLSFPFMTIKGFITPNIIGLIAGLLYIRNRIITPHEVEESVNRITTK